MIEGFREWAPAKRRKFENMVGLQRPASFSHPDVEATKGMSEDDELDYLKKKYIPELNENNKKETT